MPSVSTRVTVWCIGFERIGLDQRWRGARQRPSHVSVICFLLLWYGPLKPAASSPYVIRKAQYEKPKDWSLISQRFLKGISGYPPFIFNRLFLFSSPPKPQDRLSVSDSSIHGVQRATRILNSRLDFSSWSNRSFQFLSKYQKWISEQQKLHQLF